MTLAFFLVGLFSYSLISLISSVPLSLAGLSISAGFLAFRRQFLGFLFCVCGFLTLSLSQWTLLRAYWPAPVVLCFVLAGIFVFFSRYRDEVFGKFRFQRIWILSSLALGAFAFLVVWAWVLVFDVSASQIVFKIPGDGSLPVVVLAIFGFSLLNSFAEEFLFRGLGLACLSLAPLAANFLQALAFGLYHFEGFPFGISGAILAGVFAFCLGFLRQRSGSFIYLWLSHFFANIFMGILLYSMS